MGIAAHVAFPILALAPTTRHMGVVCLDGRFRSVLARTCRIHDLKADVLPFLVSRVERALRERSPGTVVIEADLAVHYGPLADEIGQHLEAHVRDTGLRVVRRTLEGACRRLSGSGSPRDVASLLVQRYPPLERRLARGNQYECWRETRPLLGAFALAHATALDLLTDATRGQASPPLHQL